MLYKLAISLTRFQKYTILLVSDMILIGISYFATIKLLLGEHSIFPTPMALGIELAILLIVGTSLTIWFGLHKVKLNAYQIQGIIETSFVTLGLVVAGTLTSFVVPGVSLPVSFFIVVGMFFLILSISLRLILRQILLQIYRFGTTRTSLLIYGAGQTGQQLASMLATDSEVQPVAFLDDDTRAHGLMIAGLRVHNPAELGKLIKKYDAKRIILAMPTVSRTIQSILTRRLIKTGLEVHALPSFADIVANTAQSLTDTRPIDVNDLLGRERLEEELPGVSDAYQNKHILVTGAGGSIGSELCRQLCGCLPASITLMDHSEHSLYQIDRELREICPETKVKSILGSVCDPALVTETMTSGMIDIVLHAAAYKHVPLVEDNALEGMNNNVLGTKVVADAARATGAEKFILVSTDKAVRPSSMMGASKRLAELAVQDLATRSKTTKFSMVRFGNVLGSSGSVIPLFQEQIARGGPVTLTHNDVTRYFMTIPEAVRLVLLAGSFARGGDVFVLDMGIPVPVRHVAKQLIERSGHTVRGPDNPNGDIEIQITGLRPGEKLHEELLIGSDMLTTPHPKILRAQEDKLSEIEMAKALNSLREAIEARNHEKLAHILDQWIETDPEVPDITVNE